MTITNPSSTSMPSAEKRKRAIRSSIQTKIAFWAGLCLSLVSLILISYSAITLRQRSIDNSTKEAAAVAEATAGAIKNQLDSPYIAAHTLALSLGAVKDTGIPISLSREEANAMLRKVLIQNPSFLGTYTLWEPNAFDGLDARYVRAVAHDDTGRFIPYWIRGDDGIIHTEALTRYETPGDGDWYMVPRETKQQTTIAPIYRRIQGRDVVIASFIVPILQNGIFYGIAGVDAPIGFVQEFVDNINLYDGTVDAVIFTDTGTLVAVRQQPQLTSLSADLIYKDFDKIRPQLNSSFTRLSPDGNYLQIFSPIDINEGETHWIMGLIIPIEKITAPATSTALRQVALSIVVILIALLILWLLAGQIVRPIQVLTNAAQAVSEGQWTITADVHSNDETEVLANAFNSMTAQLRNSFSTLEQRVADRTKALATTTEVSRQLSTILDQQELVSEVVKQVNNAFGYYHTQIYFFDAKHENLVMAGGTGEVGKMMLAQFHKVMKGRGLVGRAAASNQVVLVSDTMQNPEWLQNPLLPDTRSEVAIPIAIGDEVLGVLDIQHNVAGALQQEDVDSLQSIANQVAIAFQNTRSYTEIQRSQAQLAEALNISRLAYWEYDVETDLFTFNDHFYSIFRTTVEKAGGYKLSSADYARLFVHPEDAILVGSEIQKVLVSKERYISTSVEHRTIFENGEIGYFSVNVNVERDDDGKILRWYGANQDVSERRHLEEINRKRAFQQEAINTITQKIQSASDVETALKVATRELGHALRTQTAVQLDISDGQNSTVTIGE